MYKGVVFLFIFCQVLRCEIKLFVAPVILNIMVAGVGSHCHRFVYGIHILYTHSGLKKSNRMFTERNVPEFMIVEQTRKSAVKR